MRFIKELSISLIECEAWWQAMRFQEVQNSMEQCVIHFGYPKMHHMSHISVLFQYVGSGNTFPTDISEWLHMSNVNERYQSTNKVKYIRQMLK
jgi:hypothetical protein